MVDLGKLAEPFDRSEVHWRAQTITQSGDKALALAYIDARDVMNRLDAVCGPAGWQSRYTETPRGRVLCEIGINVGGEWIWKSDGAGDTAVEGEKGGISDALKRAAVQWGIGRYLYRLGNVWAPCQCTERNGKKVWKDWIGTPWDAVRSAPPRASNAAPAQRQEKNQEPAPAAMAAQSLRNADTLDALVSIWSSIGPQMQRDPVVLEAKNARKVELT